MEVSVALAFSLVFILEEYSESFQSLYCIICFVCLFSYHDNIERSIRVRSLFLDSKKQLIEPRS